MLCATHLLRSSAKLLFVIGIGCLANHNSLLAEEPFFFSDYTNKTIDFVATPGGPIQTIATTSGNPWGVAVDGKDGYVYWIDKGGGGATSSNITRANFDGSNPVTILSVPVQPGNPYVLRGLTLDVGNNWIYYTEGNTGTIRRIHLDGTGGQVVASVGGDAIDVALDVPDNKMYWTQITSTTSELFSANLNGTNAHQLFTDQGFYYGLAVDPAHGYLYFADQHPNQMAIRRINVDGTNPTTLISAGEPSGGRYRSCARKTVLVASRYAWDLECESRWYERSAANSSGKL
jgi:DNA-binding beta-propeller fold protein YncE